MKIAAVLLVSTKSPTAKLQVVAVSAVAPPVSVLAAAMAFSLGARLRASLGQKKGRDKPDLEHSSFSKFLKRHRLTGDFIKKASIIKLSESLTSENFFTGKKRLFASNFH